MLRYFPIFFAPCFLLYLLPAPAVAELVTRFSKKTYTTGSSGIITTGQHCPFYTVAGEEIIVNAFYKGSSGVFPFQLYGAINNGGLPVLEARMNNNQRVSLRRFITTTQVGNSTAIWGLGSHSSLEYEILSDRTNLKVSTPTIDSSNGTLTLPHSVTTAKPFTPGSIGVPLRLFSYSETMPNSTQLGEWGLRNCVNKALCSDTISIPLSQRSSIPRGILL